MEWIIQILAVLLGLLLAVVKSMHYTPNELSDFELARKARAGDAQAIAEQDRRTLLPTYMALQYSKEIVISVLIAVLVLGVNGSVVGSLLVVLYLLAAYVVAARGWLAPWAQRLQHLTERHASIVKRLTPFVRWLAPQRITPGGAGIASREEFKELITNDTKLLSPADKARLLGALNFGSLLVSDVMVPRDNIATVDSKETVGPVLLDRLHKDGHNVFVVVKKDDINRVQGWLYMRDLVPLDPELKKVADAVRPTVHYLPVNAPLESVLSAAITTGRQLFLVQNDAGETQGLISLGDALAKLNGQPVPKAAPLTT